MKDKKYHKGPDIWGPFVSFVVKAFAANTKQMSVLRSF
jgi:hypothetical protein